MVETSSKSRSETLSEVLGETLFQIFSKISLKSGQDFTKTLVQISQKRKLKKFTRNLRNSEETFSEITSENQTKVLQKVIFSPPLQRSTKNFTYCTGEAKVVSFSSFHLEFA